MAATKVNEITQKCQAFFTDTNGKVVMWQSPNIPLVGWFVFKVLSMIAQASSLKGGFENLSTVFLFTWAYLEIVSGKSYFRRVLGIIVMTAVVIGYFKKS